MPTTRRGRQQLQPAGGFIFRAGPAAPEAFKFEILASHARDFSAGQTQIRRDARL